MVQDPVVEKMRVVLEVVQVQEREPPVQVATPLATAVASSGLTSMPVQSVLPISTSTKTDVLRSSLSLVASVTLSPLVALLSAPHFPKSTSRMAGPIPQP